jgi:hypothetical protein
VQEIAPSAGAVLSLAVVPSGIQISWPGSLSNYQLQSANSLTVLDWTSVTNVPAPVNGQNTVIVEPTAARKFYRLQRAQ